MENENLDLDVKPAGNKDMWLFLIIVDIVLLCVFGFFLYRHFSATLFHSETQNAQPVIEAQTMQPIPQEQPALQETPVQPEPPVAVVQLEETSVAEVLAAQAKAAEKKEAQAAEQAKLQAEPKQSIVVEVNPKSKYRKVTFRWFGDGDKVAVVSGFTMSKPKALTKKKEYWETTLSIAPGTYKFLYVIDGKNQRDPYAPEKDGRSILIVE